MAGDGSIKTVVTAIVVNFSVTIAKTIGWLISMSPSMLAEAIHSLADTANQTLVFVGIRVSKKGPTRDFPVGYGQSRYLWNLLSASGIFFVGFGVTTYHGVSSLFSEHHSSGSFSLIMLILGYSFIAEGYALWVAYKDVYSQKGNKTLAQWITQGDDPTSVGILIEDGIAVMGVVLAFVGVILTKYFHNPIFDSIASIVIGLLLGSMAIIIGYANGRLLLNRSVSISSEEEIRQFLVSLPEIKSISNLKTEIVSPEFISLSVDFDIDTSTILQSDDTLSKKLTDKGIEAKELDASFKLVGQFINKIENSVYKKFPEIKQISLEVD